MTKIRVEFCAYCRGVLEKGKYTEIMFCALLGEPKRCKVHTLCATRAKEYGTLLGVKDV
jgi:hypothetical protein